MFKKYHCPKCNSILPFWKVKRKSEYYCFDIRITSYMCLECGNQEDVIPREKRIDEIIREYTKG
jgi:RNase P subunit RPR2